MKSLAIAVSALALAAAVSGCGHLPEFPGVTRYAAKNQINGRKGFYGRHSKDENVRVYKTFDDPTMDGAQCLDKQDYKTVEDWIDAVEEIAKRRCK